MNPQPIKTISISGSEPKEAEKEEKPDLEESVKAFNKFMDELPEETLNEIVNEVNATGIEGPTVEEYFASLSPATKQYVARLQQEITTLRASLSASERFRKEDAMSAINESNALRARIAELEANGTSGKGR